MSTPFASNSPSGQAAEHALAVAVAGDLDEIMRNADCGAQLLAHVVLRSLRDPTHRSLLNTWIASLPNVHPSETDRIRA